MERDNQETPTDESRIEVANEGASEEMRFERNRMAQSSATPISSNAAARSFHEQQSDLPSSSTIAASPPRFVTMDKVVETIHREAERLQLAHEIAVNSDFKLEQRPGPCGGATNAYAAIQQNMLKAYWDIIEEDIGKEPPVLDMVFKLCDYIKQMLLELLLPHQNQMRTEIEELFDLELIEQRCVQAKSISSLREYGPAVLNIMQRLCCPMRDEEIQALRQVDNTVQLFQGIVRVLQEMKLDYANFLIQQLRPIIKETIHDYEKEKMKDIENAQKMVGVEEPFAHTKAWLQRAFDDLYSVDQRKPSGEAILLQGYMQLVFQAQYINEEWELPETLLLDRERIVKLQQAYLVLAISSATILITQSYVPPAMASSSDFKRQLKEACFAVLQEVQCMSDSDVREAMQGLARKIVQDIQRQSNGVALTPERETLLQGQLIELANSDHPVRNVVFGRIVAFVSLMAKGGSRDVVIPQGLSTLETELTNLAGDFMQIISLNRTTYAEKYNSILTDIRDAKPTA